jgi:hypothetical protein
VVINLRWLLALCCLEIGSIILKQLDLYLSLDVTIVVLISYDQIRLVLLLYDKVDD